MVSPTTPESRALVLTDPSITKQETDKSSRLYQISLIAGVIIISVGVVLIALETLPLLSIGAVAMGMGLVIYSTSRLEKKEQKTDAPQLIGGYDPLVFDDALKILGVPEEEKENLAWITEKYNNLLQELQKKIDSGNLPAPFVLMVQNMMKNSKTAYLTVTKNLEI